MACGAVIGSNRSQIVFEVCVSARNLWLTTPLAQKLWLQVCYLEKAVRKPQFFIEATSFYEPSLCQESAHHMTSVYIQDDSIYPLWISASAYTTSLLLCLLTCKVILYNLCIVRWTPTLLQLFIVQTLRPLQFSLRWCNDHQISPQRGCPLTDEH